MSNGATAKFLPWCGFRRSPEAIWYAVYGTKGMMETDRWGSTVDRVNVYVEGSKESVKEKSYTPRPWLETELARRTGGHGGSDFYTMHFFLEAILNRPGKRHVIDVYRALDMTLPGTLGFRSIMQGNVPLDVPDFRKESVRNRYRHDRWCLDPKLAGPGQPKTSCSWGPVKVPASVYRKQQAEYRRR